MLGGFRPHAPFFAIVASNLDMREFWFEGKQARLDEFIGEYEHEMDCSDVNDNLLDLDDSEVDKDEVRE